MNNRILLMGKEGKYFIAQKNKEETNLEPSTEFIEARKTIPYGFDFNFGSMQEYRFDIYGYNHFAYKELEARMHEQRIYSKEEKLKEYAKENLNRVIKGLENMIEENKADYVLLDYILSRDMNTSWDFSGRGQLIFNKE